jgi:hypothetical protein
MFGQSIPLDLTVSKKITSISKDGVRAETINDNKSAFMQKILSFQ